eukprot:PhF_6_TR29116/c0_g1_i1/m.42488/K00797/speE, SRM; spermidine synthase
MSAEAKEPNNGKPVFWPTVTQITSYIAFTSLCALFAIIFAVKVPTSVCFGGMFRTIPKKPLYATSLDISLKTGYVFTHSIPRESWIRSTSRQSTPIHFSIYADSYHGNLFLIDNTVWYNDKDEINFYEMMTYSPFHYLLQPKANKGDAVLNVLMLYGGGSVCMKLHELLLNPTVPRIRIDLVEPDSDIIIHHTWKYYFPHMYAGVTRFQNSGELTLHNSTSTLGSSQYDIVFLDHVRTSELTVSLLRDVASRLSKDQPSLAIARVAPFQVQAIRNQVKGIFQHTHPLCVYSPTQVGGMLCMIIFSNSVDPEKNFVRENANIIMSWVPKSVHYYSHDSHWG